MIRKFGHIVLCVVMTALTACTEVELCEEDFHPHLATITVRYHWNAGDEATAPDSMNIIASRLMNTWRAHGVADTKTGYAWNGTLPTGTVLPDRPNPEEPEEEPSDQPTDDTTGSDDTTEGETGGNGGGTDVDLTRNDNGDVDVEVEGDNDTPDTPEADPRAPFRLKGGEYSMVTINAFKNLSIRPLQEYLDNKPMDIDTLELVPIIMPRNEVPDLRGLNLPDFNPKYKYVPNIGRVFFDVQRGINIETGKEATIDFYPQPISRAITIRFDVELLTGNMADGYTSVQIDSIVGEISGICGHMNLMNHNVDIENIYRIIYRPTCAEQCIVQTGTTGRTFTWDGTFHTMGLVPSYNKDYTTGPGIMQLAVFASITWQGSDGKEHKKHRIYYAGANPREDFINAQILEVRSDGKYYLSNTEDLLIILSAPLQIDGSDILNYEEENIWFKAGETIDIDA
ncbi:MAG: hypothetical protein E7099_10035 [Mediterranea massiliensis]|nr:hypothetical protein [Mediterranea massiliensis]